MVYDADPSTIAWFEAALSSSRSRVRWRAVELLRDIDGPHRTRWLEAAASDPDPRVAATAVLVTAAIVASVDLAAEDLFESDFAEGVERGPLGWEWEYRVLVCRGLCAPSAGVLVWTRDEDDAEAKRLAVLKACAGERDSGTAVPILVSKRFVNRYTRSARSMSEAVRWHHQGRPRLDDRE